jgi:hypothetical protein
VHVLLRSQGGGAAKSFSSEGLKSTVMSYLDNLITWGDNLFSTEGREALSEATLLYVIASEILGPAPVAVTPPPHADESYDQLEPLLGKFANAMVEVENVIGGAGVTGGSGGGNSGAAIPAPPAFYFKIPSNPQLLGYWGTVDLHPARPVTSKQAGQLPRTARTASASLYHLHTVYIRPPPV